eukprot:TRINITY_DN10663_c0_g1_i1.p1 TRINITY_DN10663_c0_g1~~TRINITY_DN10663_c0_g1_i1.p1  ORF type:complete len:214 (+),score=42.38 TRINITY_DN10663_c0_g1_i1:213-854(+)
MSSPPEEDQTGSPAEGRRKRGASFMSRVKRTLAYNISNTSFGKNAVFNLLPYESQNLVRALSSIIAKDPESKITPNQLESNIIKFMVQAGVEKDAGNIRFRDFYRADPTLRESFDTLCKIYKFYGNFNSTAKRDLTPYFKKVQELNLQTIRIIQDLLGPFVNEKDLSVIEDIYKEIGTAEFLQRIWNNPDLEEEMFELYNAMQSYTQFHYHFE